MITRFALPENKNSFRSLYTSCFNDEEKFVDFMFLKKFAPQYSAGTFDGDRLVSALSATPVTISVRGTSIPAALVYGVCTDSEYSGKGLMTTTFSYFLENSGFSLFVHTPVVPATYMRLSHLPVSETAHLKSYSSAASKRAKILDAANYREDISRIYGSAAKNYSGIVLRDADDWDLKIADYTAGDGQFIGLFDGKMLLGYAVIFETPEKLICEEMFCACEADRRELIAHIFSLAAGRECDISLPPDLELGTAEIQGVAGIVRPEIILKLLGKNLPVTVGITDEKIPQNCGVYDFKGKKLEDVTPDFELKAGELAQLLFGYKALSELDARIYKKDAADVIAKNFKKCVCYIVDKY